MPGTWNLLRLQLKYPHLPAVILIVFVIALHGELSSVHQLSFALFNLRNFCLENNLLTTPGSVGKANVFRFVFYYLTFPIAGWLADAKFGRQKVITMSIWLMWWGLLIMVPVLLLITLNPALPLKYPHQCNSNLLLIIGGTFLGASMILFYVGAAGFLPNSLPFIVDQLTDMSSSWVSSYIRWYSWAQYLGYILGTFPLVFYNSKLRPPPLVIVAVILLFTHTIVIVANILCQTLFTQSQGYDDPYKTVFRVVNFARKHKVPIRRSAMTYWENSLPGRLDLGKEKYGGPFKNEKVENVKTFFSIVVVLLSLFGYYIAYSGAFNQLPNFVTCFHVNTTTPLVIDIIQYGVSSFTHRMVAILLIPTLEIIVHCFASKFEYFLNKPFIWIGVGILFFSISNGALSVSAAINFAINENKSTVNTTGYFVGLLEIPTFFFGLADVMIFTSALYLICCQAPTSMRGMLIGVFFLARGWFDTTVGSLYSIFHCLSSLWSWVTCFFLSWFILAIVGTASIPVYVVVARRYKRRERQEIVNYRRMIESVFEREIRHDEDIEELLAQDSTIIHTCRKHDEDKDPSKIHVTTTCSISLN